MLLSLSGPVRFGVGFGTGNGPIAFLQSVGGEQFGKRSLALETPLTPA